MGKVDCFLPRLSVDLTHWDLQEAQRSEHRVHRTSANVNTLPAVREWLEQLPVPCVTRVSVRTQHILHACIHCDKVVQPAGTNSAQTCLDRSVSLPCGACPGSLFERFRSCCAVVPAGAHGHSWLPGIPSSSFSAAETDGCSWHCTSSKQKQSSS